MGWKIEHVGYIDYNNKTTRVRICKEKKNIRILITDDGDILEDPYDSHVYDTYEDCEYWRTHESDFVPQDE